MNKLVLITKLKLTIGPLYIITLIQIIKKAKIIFINELKLGKQVRIPHYLMIKYTKDSKNIAEGMPFSLQFYNFFYTIFRHDLNEADPKMAIVQLVKANTIANDMDILKK